MGALDRWPGDAGHSVRMLGRVLSVLLAAMVALIVVYQLVDSLLPPSGSMPRTALMVTLLTIFVWRGATGSLGAADLLILVAACLVDLVEATLSEADTLNLSTTVLSSLFVVAAPCLLRRRAAVVVGISFVVLLAAAQVWLAGQVGRQILDVAVINVAFVFTVMVLVDLLHRAARVNDDLHERMHEGRVREQRARSRQRSEARAQRLIHDEVITALRVVADRATADPEAVRTACRDAVAAVRAFGRAP